MVWKAFRIRDNHDVGRARAPTYSDAIATLGKEKSASVLLSSVKARSTKGLLIWQTCEGILCAST